MFDREGAVSALMPVLPYVPVAPDGGDRLDYDSRDSRRSGRRIPSYVSSGLPGEGYSPYGAPVCVLKGSALHVAFNVSVSQLMNIRTCSCRWEVVVVLRMECMEEVMHLDAVAVLGEIISSLMYL